jgi:hypothetical protein
MELFGLWLLPFFEVKIQVKYFYFEKNTSTEERKILYLYLQLKIGVFRSQLGSLIIIQTGPTFLDFLSLSVRLKVFQKRFCLVERNPMIKGWNIVMKKTMRREYSYVDLYELIIKINRKSIQLVDIRLFLRGKSNIMLSFVLFVSFLSMIIEMFIWIFHIRYFYIEKQVKIFSVVWIYRIMNYWEIFRLRTIERERSFTSPNSTD